MLAAASLMISGMGAHDAIKAVSRARGIAVPETPGQLGWLKNLASEYLAVASSTSA